MADNKFRYPPAPPNGNDEFSRNLVGLQITDGGGLTQGNFEFTQNIGQKSNRIFDIGSFSEPISLSNLQIENIEQAKQLVLKNFQVYPNYDLTKVTNFSLYGSLQTRLSGSIRKIINYFPACIEVDRVFYDYTTGLTAYDIQYDVINNITEFKIDTNRIKNPFSIDYSANARRNVEVNPNTLSYLRNLTSNFLKYSLLIDNDLDKEFTFVDFEPSQFLTGGTLEISVSGNPFNGLTETTKNLILKPNKLETEIVFNENFDEVEKFLLNQKSVPIYTSKFEVVEEDINGRFYKTTKSVTWPVDGSWNLDIRTENYEDYLRQVNRIGVDLDEFKTNLISRFLTTGSFKDFDTEERSMEKILQIYGRSFDEIKKFIDALANINSVNYVVKDDIPSQLLKNLAQTLGWDTKISPITNSDFIDSVFDTNNGSAYSGVSKEESPTELNFQYYRNLILNSAYLFKSKGTHRSLEYILRMIGAPKALIEFNETIYLADGPINMDQFNMELNSFSGGTKIEETVVLNPNDIFTYEGTQFTGFTVESVIFDVDATINDYPVDDDGYPKSPGFSDNFFFQQGAGWFEQTNQHRSLEQLDITNSTFTGSAPSIQTNLETFTYGQKYLDRFINFPYMNLGYEITRIYDNKKSWSDSEIGFRSNVSGGLNSYYQVDDERLILNSKNIEVYLNMGQGLVYDVWDMSKKLNYPIPNSGLTSNQQNQTGIDRTIINPQPRSKTFFEFAQTFYQNMINVRNRQSSSYNYTSLRQIYWDYINSEQTVNLPSNRYTYQKMIDFTDGLGDHWIKLLEQMVPASTLWTAGQKFENSAFDRHKVVWRKQRGCEIIPLGVPCIPCQLTGPIFTYDCVTQSISCDLSVDDMSLLLNQVIETTLTSNGYVLSDCDTNSLTSNWKGQMLLGSTLIQEWEFFNGFGTSQVPTEESWIDSVLQVISGVTTFGLVYTYEDNIVQVSNAGCDSIFGEDSFTISIKIDINITCTENNTGLITYLNNEPAWASYEKMVQYAQENDIDGYYTEEYQNQLVYIAGQRTDKPTENKIEIVRNPFINGDTNTNSENLIAGLNELFYLDGTPYPQGERYHIHPGVGPMVGAYHSNLPHQYLTFTNPTIRRRSNVSNPITNTQSYTQSTSTTSTTNNRSSTTSTTNRGSSGSSSGGGSGGSYGGGY